MDPEHMERARGSLITNIYVRSRVLFLDMTSTEPLEYFQFPEELEQVLLTDPDHTISTSTKHSSVQAPVTHLMLETFHHLPVLIQLEDELARFRDVVSAFFFEREERCIKTEGTRLWTSV
jgi:hypothetical protein